MKNSIGINMLLFVLILISLSSKFVQAQSQDCCFTRNCTRVDFLTDQHPYNPDKNSKNKQPEQKDAGLTFLMHPLFENTNQCFFSMSYNCRNEQDLTECLPCCCETLYSSQDTVEQLADLSSMTQEEWLEFNGYDNEPEVGDFVQVCNDNWRDVMNRAFTRISSQVNTTVSVAAYASAQTYNPPPSSYP